MLLPLLLEFPVCVVGGGGGENQGRVVGLTTWYKLMGWKTESEETGAEVIRCELSYVYQ